MGIVSLFLLITFFIPSWAFKQGQLLKSYTINSYKSRFSLNFNGEMVPVFDDGSTATLRLVGQLKEVAKVAMTTSPSDCLALQESTVSNINHISDEEASFTLVMPTLETGETSLYFCLNTTNKAWAHQGSENWARVVVSTRILSFPLTIIFIILCLVISGTLSGLILGLMSWDMADLEVVASARGRKERKYGRVILSVRKHGNFLLISLVMGATILNSVFTVLINMFVSEWLTVVCVTLAIVSCCEIIPDLVVSRYALVVGAITIFLTWTVMVLTSPLSYPLGKLLDKLIRDDIWSLTRNRLRDVAKGLLSDGPEDLGPYRESPESLRLQRFDVPHMPEGIISEMSTGGDEGPTRKSYYGGGFRRPIGRSFPSNNQPSTPKELSPSRMLPMNGGKGPNELSMPEDEDSESESSRLSQHNFDS